MSNFTIIDSAVATQSRNVQSKYAEALSNLSVSTKNADGTFSGPAIAAEKDGQVLCFRDAAKRLGVSLITRRQKDGKTYVWKVAKEDAPVRKVSEKTEKKSDKATKATK